MKQPLSLADPEIYQAIRNETRRQEDGLELIASENFVSEAVLEATGSVFTNKYSEGYPGRRYYGGCEFVDIVENLARDRAKELFGAEHANVQPHSGSSANLAVMMAVLEPGDKVLGMNLSHGGHLTHGHRLNFSGKLYDVSFYGVRESDERIDYDELAEIAQREKPRLIIAGASAYSRIIDFERMGRIARETGAHLMCDIAHIAGLIVAGKHPSPIPHADLVTTTTHKTLRGPRGGLILCRQQFAKDIDRSVMPGTQGGPLVHAIAAKAVCFKEAAYPEFSTYQGQIVSNAKKLAASLAAEGFRIVSGGTDNHVFLVDVFSKGITGKDAERNLDEAGITVNKNGIPFDTNPPLVAGGIRIGTPAVTTRGMKEPEMERIASLIARALAPKSNAASRSQLREEVRKLCKAFPLYAHRLEAAQASVA